MSVDDNDQNAQSTEDGCSPRARAHQTLPHNIRSPVFRSGTKTFRMLLCILVQWITAKNRGNRALWDKSMKLGTHILEAMGIIFEDYGHSVF